LIRKDLSIYGEEIHLRALFAKIDLTLAQRLSAENPLIPLSPVSGEREAKEAVKRYAALERTATFH
jgi:hypothetical protein